MKSGSMGEVSVWQRTEADIKWLKISKVNVFILDKIMFWILAVSNMKTFCKLKSVQIEYIIFFALDHMV